MDRIIVRKESLLKVLRANRLEHIEEHKKAVKGYWLTTVDNLVKALALAEENTTINWSEITNQEPYAHTNEYDEAIEMLELTEEEKIHLSKDQYRKYYKNHWSWKTNWDMNNSVYLLRAES